MGQIEKNPKRINLLFRQFFDEFFLNLKDFTINFSDRDANTIGKEICENISLYTPLRNDYIGFLDKLITSALNYDIDIFLDFFGKLPSLLYPQDGRSSWSEYEFDNFRFIIHELFLYS